MRRLLSSLTLACSLAIALVAPVAAADFPEQPGEPIPGCATLGSLPLDVLLQISGHAPATAARLLEQLIDACGP